MKVSVHLWTETYIWTQNGFNIIYCDSISAIMHYNAFFDTNNNNVIELFPWILKSSVYRSDIPNSLFVYFKMTCFSSNRRQSSGLGKGIGTLKVQWLFGILNCSLNAMSNIFSKKVIQFCSKYNCCKFDWKNFGNIRN